MRNRRWIRVLWPAFLAASVLEMLVFAAVDPLEIQTLAGNGMGRMTVYAVAFFVFWGIAALAGWMSLLLSMSARELNVPTVGPAAESTVTAWRQQ